MKKIIIIPARFQSKRFPGKPLKKILNKELVIWVAEACDKVLGNEFVYIATDDERIDNKVKEYGFKTILTSKDCLTGTDRVAEASLKIESDIYINVQGDEPLVKPQDIKKIIDKKIEYPNHVICGYTEILESEDPLNKNIPKIVLSENSELIYISRSIIPSSKEENFIKKNKFLKQVCIYAFNKSELKQFYNFKKKSKTEMLEDIEILRFFEFDKKIKMVKTTSGSVAVDQENDIAKVEQILNKNGKKN